MFERFTDGTRRVLVLAQEEARLLNHAFIGTEHLLLGVVHEGESVAAIALDALGVTIEAARAMVTEYVGPATSVPTGSRPFTPRCKKVLENSLREALQLGHNYIGTEHLLLGLLRETESVAVRVLVDLGTSPEQVRAELIRSLTDRPEEPVRSWVEGDPATRVGLLAPSGGSDTGVCPGCRNSLADTLRWRAQEVPGADPTDPVRDVTIWWCRACGRTISVTPEGAPRQARTVATPESIPESEEVRVQFLRQGRPVAGIVPDLGSDRIALERIYDTSSDDESLQPEPGAPTTGAPVEPTEPPPAI